MKFSTFTKLLFPLTGVFFSLSSEAITISPATHILETQAGSSKTFVVRVLNDSNEKAVIDCYLSDIELDKDGRKIFRPAGTTSQSVAKYITIAEPKKFTLNPNETKEVTLSINVPEGVVGGNKAIAFFQSTPEASSGSGKKMVMSVRAGATILQETIGTVDIRSRIKSADVVFPGKEPLTFKMGVINEGNTHIMTGGSITIIGENDSFIGSMEIKKTVVFPGREATLESKLPGVYKLKSGTYHALVTYQYRDKSISIDKVFTVK